MARIRGNFVSVCLTGAHVGDVKPEGIVVTRGLKLDRLGKVLHRGVCVIRCVLDQCATKVDLRIVGCLTNTDGRVETGESLRQVAEIDQRLADLRCVMVKMRCELSLAGSDCASGSIAARAALIRRQGCFRIAVRALHVAKVVRCRRQVVLPLSIGWIGPCQPLLDGENLLIGSHGGLQIALRFLHSANAVVRERQVLLPARIVGFAFRQHLYDCEAVIERLERVGIVAQPLLRIADPVQYHRPITLPAGVGGV